MIYSLIFLCSIFIPIYSSQNNNKLDNCQDQLIKQVYSEVSYLKPFYSGFYIIFKGDTKKLKLFALHRILDGRRMFGKDDEYRFIVLLLQDDEVAQLMRNFSSLENHDNPVITAFNRDSAIAKLFAQLTFIGPLHVSQEAMLLKLIEQAERKESVLEDVSTRVFYDDERLQKNRQRHSSCVQLLLNSNCPIESLDENLFKTIEGDGIQLFGPDDPHKHNPTCIYLIKKEYLLQQKFIEYINNYPDLEHRFALHNKFLPWKMMMLNRKEINPEKRELFLCETAFLSDEEKFIYESLM